MATAGRTLAYRSKRLRIATLTESWPPPLGVVVGPLSARPVRWIDSIAFWGIAAFLWWNRSVMSPGLRSTAPNHSPDPDSHIADNRWRAHRENRGLQLTSNCIPDTACRAYAMCTAGKPVSAGTPAMPRWGGMNRPDGASRPAHPAHNAATRPARSVVRSLAGIRFPCLLRQSWPTPMKDPCHIAFDRTMRTHHRRYRTL